jgi:ubiquinone/menaquinone biosynthesis C-methylase UbiE
MTESQSEISHILDRYRAQIECVANKTVWAPFAEREIDLRLMQTRVFAESMRSVGRQNLAGLDVLDLGCGDGRHLRNFIDFGADPARLQGADIQSARVASARALSHPAIRFVLHDGMSLPFPDASFDLVTQHFVMSNISGPILRQKLASEIIRILRPNGLFFWWDISKTANVSRDPGQANCARDFCPGLIWSRRVAHLPNPSDVARPWKGLARPFLRLLDQFFAHQATFEAALFRPCPARL